MLGNDSRLKFFETSWSPWQGRPNDFSSYTSNKNDGSVLEVRRSRIWLSGKESASEQRFTVIWSQIGDTGIQGVSEPWT